MRTKLVSINKPVINQYLRMWGLRLCGGLALTIVLLQLPVWRIAFEIGAGPLFICQFVGGQNWQTSRYTGLPVGLTGQTGLGLFSPSRARFVIQSTFVTQLERGTFSLAYKYKSYDRLRVYTTIESFNLQFTQILAFPTS